MSRVQSNIGNLTEIFRRLQGAQQLGPLQKEAVKAQKDVRTDIERLFAEQAAGFQENVSAGLQQQATKQREKLADRGMSPQALHLLQNLGVERQSPLVLNQLRDKLTAGRLDALTGISKNLANIFTGATEQGTGLLSQLLGSLDRVGSIGARHGTTGLSIQKGRGPGQNVFSSMFLRQG